MKRIADRVISDIHEYSGKDVHEEKLLLNLCLERLYDTRKKIRDKMVTKSLERVYKDIHEKSDGDPMIELKLLNNYISKLELNPVL